MRKIILASNSIARKKFLENAGLVFIVVPSNYEEDMTLPMAPGELAKFLSLGKAEDVAKSFDDAIIISADTFVSIDNRIIGKPHTADIAYKTLRTLSGKTHTVVTGFTIIDTKINKIFSKAVETKVTFKELTDEMINYYIKNYSPLKFAGSYTLRDVENTFIENIEGDHSNIIGLPIDEVMNTLKNEFGVKAQ